MHLHDILTAVALAALLPTAGAHSWVESLRNINPDDYSFVGEPGYMRGNIMRYSPGFIDTRMQHKLVPPDNAPPDADGVKRIAEGAPLCRPEQQQAGADGPALKAPPGGFVAALYLEAGHVTRMAADGARPANRGTVYIYGTAEPDPSFEFKKIHTRGGGGDGRVKLLAKQDFDDKQCYESPYNADGTIKQPPAPEPQLAIERLEAAKAAGKSDDDPLMGANLWCQNNFQLPPEAQAGSRYTVYWVWDWPILNTATGEESSEEFYTTCLDIDVTSDDVQSASSGPQGSGPGYKAIPAYMDPMKGGGGQSSGGQAPAEEPNLSTPGQSKISDGKPRHGETRKCKAKRAVDAADGRQPSPDAANLAKRDDQDAACVTTQTVTKMATETQMATVYVTNPVQKRSVPTSVPEPDEEPKRDDARHAEQHKKRHHGSRFFRT